jgi:putative nucleotidyltransferase with HDIG domain
MATPTLSTSSPVTGPASPAERPATIDAARIPLREILSALSFALDLTEGAVPGHAIRCCLYGMTIARELGLSQQQSSDLYYALLLKDVGCSSNSQRMCLVTGGDDVAIKHDVKFLDWTRPSVAALATLWHRAAQGGSVAERVQRILRLALERNRNNQKMIELRCDRGASIARKIGLREASAQAIRLLDEHWDGSGYPLRAYGRHIPLLARILLVAQHLDVFAAERGLSAAMDELVVRSGRWFDPELVRVSLSLYRRGLLARAVQVPDIQQAVMDLEPIVGNALPASRIDCICEAFSDVVDAKSSFTYRHSIGVTHAALGIARQLGFPAPRTKVIYRAALLHDLGKLSVPNTILDKPGKLSDEEWRVMRHHAALSQQILSRITPFAEVARIAGQHHEKLDGSGYPFGLSARELSLDARIITVADIYGALTEERPYRPPIPAEQVLQSMRRDVPHKLDADCVEALERYLQSESAPV